MQTTQRIHSIDVARGVAMVLMAIDHVRVYAGVPPGGPRLGVFLTRWITNFVAPAFAFLAGTSAYLLGRRLDDRGALARYLVTRGLILVLLELTVIRVAWTFNFDFGHYLLAGVIWMLGWCMVLLAALVWLPTAVIGAFGVAVIALHNVLDFVSPPVEQLAQSPLAWLWQILYFGGPIQLGHNGPTLMVLYSIVPWIGVMAAGYAFGAVMTLEPSRRDRICVTIAASAIVLFLLLRAIDVYGDPRHWHVTAPTPMPTAFRFINHQVSSVASVSADDARPDDSPAAACGARTQQDRRVCRDLRPSADVLLSDSHSGDPLHGGDRRAGAGGKGGSVALRESSDDEPAAARGLHLEAVAAVRGVHRRGGSALLPVPLVRAQKGDESGDVDALHLRLHR